MKKRIILLSLLAIAFAYSSNFAQIPSNGLVAFYPFNGNANDESGNGNDGNVIGATLTEDRCSSPDSAFQFHGYNNYITLPPSAFILNEYSYSVWIKVSTFPAQGDDGWMIFSPGSYNTGLCQGLSIHSDGGICGTSYNIGGNPHGSWAITPPIQTGQWFHLVYTRSYEVLKIYVNGDLMPYVDLAIYSPYTNNQPANYGSSSFSAIIGCRSNFKSDDFFNGSIDDLSIYNRILTEEEVQELYSSNCKTIMIHGDKTVCQGENNVNFSIPVSDQYTSFNWHYSGEDVNITGNSKNVYASFGPNATNGVLSVTASGNSVNNLSIEIPITVNQLPANAGIIAGANEVCINQNSVQYSVPQIANATSYNWYFNGSGVTYNSDSYTINADFSQNATNGQLTVSGENLCGIGTLSPEFDIQIKRPPSGAGVIKGPDEVCSNQGNISYSVPTINNADNYVWNYDGYNVTILGNSDNIKLYFLNNSTSGNLSVYGISSCGTGAPSENFPIIVKTCSVDPLGLNIPNSFSPNGDGVNDLYIIQRLPEKSRLMIFNRHGKKVFESANYLNDWNGIDEQGIALESGTYWYILLLPGIHTEFKGFVYLKK